MTKIVCFSDTHGLHADAGLTEWMMKNPADILIFAGDMQRNDYDDGKKFVNWIKDLPFAHKILTFGNHDSNYEDIISYSKEIDNLQFLINESVVCEGIHIFGSPYSPVFGNWYFMRPDKDLEEIYSKIPQDTNVVINHSPAFAYQDLTIEGAISGSRSLLRATYKLPNLRYVISGHIHEGYGIATNDRGVSFVNASVLNVKYKVNNLPIVLEY